MPKHPIESFPLIAITECLDMDSGDACGPERTVEDLLNYKFNHFSTMDSYKDWGADWKQQRPVYIETENGRPMFRNGHHRLTKAHSLGMLFVHYTNDMDIGWEQYD